MLKRADDAKYRNQLTKQFASTSAKNGLWRWQNWYRVRNRIGRDNDKMGMEASGMAGGRA